MVRTVLQDVESTAAAAGRGSIRTRTFVYSSVAALLITLPGSPAEAAQNKNYNLDYCYSGTRASPNARNWNVLDNGELRFSWCKNGNNRATTITVKYKKTGGSAIKARFGYEWVSSTAGSQYGRHWDQSSGSTVTIKKGETWGARFKRSPAEAPGPNSPCMRGLMNVSGTVYSTAVVCP